MKSLPTPLQAYLDVVQAMTAAQLSKQQLVFFLVLLGGGVWNLRVVLSRENPSSECTISQEISLVLAVFFVCNLLCETASSLCDGYGKSLAWNLREAVGIEGASDFRENGYPRMNR